jgi:hypothetical protein
MAGQVIMKGFLHREIPVWIRRLVTMVPSMIVIAIGLDPSRTLVISQVLLSFGLPFAIIPLVIFTSQKKTMGVLTNRKITSILAYMVAGIIVVLATLSQGLVPALIMLGIVVVYQQFENYVLQPTILGRAADVSGFTVLAGVLVFGALFGVVGAIIAVPIAASIQITLQELTADRRAKMAALRAAEPADSPETGAVEQ